MSRRRLAGLAAPVACLGLALGGCGDEQKTAYVVCVDSTYSTTDVRSRYLPALHSIVERGVVDGAHLYADACGSNAIGTVAWTVDEPLEARQSYGDVLLKQFAKTKADKTMPVLEEVVSKTSDRPGTPLGEILYVVAGQCEVDEGPCVVYVLTDGAWEDDWLRVHDGVGVAEEERYLERFAPLLGGLEGAQVHFGGVGLGTVLGPQQQADAKQVATALVEAGGGEVASWNVSLGAMADA